MAERGAPNGRRITLSISEERDSVVDDARREAKKRGDSLSDFIWESVRQRLDHTNRERARRSA